MHDDLKVEVAGEALTRRVLVANDEVHLNPASMLPPVGCRLLIEVWGQLIEVIRDSFVEEKSADLRFVRKEEYLWDCEDQQVFVGRFRWTYP